ncbi:hypothetical protein D9M71_722960 [compost metagenome]
MTLALLEAAIAEQHCHIDIAAKHVMAAFTGHQADVDLWIGRVKAVQPRHQPIGGKSEIGGDL